jgi:type II secretory pathway pseudopilin PulG
MVGDTPGGSAAGRKPRRPPGGITVLELGVALGLGALLVALSMPLYFGFVHERRAARVAEDLAGLLRFAQQRAVAESVDVCRVEVVTDATRAEVRRVPRDATGGCAAPVTIRVGDPYPRGVTVDPVTVGFSNAGSPTGSPTADIAISIVAGGRTRTVSVHARTGRVEITR